MATAPTGNDARPSENLAREPGKVDNESIIEFWYYPNILGGRVAFESGRVTG